MHEQQTGRKTEKLDTIISRNDGHWIPTVYRQNRLDSSAYFYSHDRRAWSNYVNRYNKELTHNLTIVITSAGAFGAGIGFLIIKLFGGW